MTTSEPEDEANYEQICEYAPANISRETWQDILEAVKSGDLDRVKDIYNSEGLDFKDFNEFDLDLLDAASKEGKLDIAKFCIEEAGFDAHNTKYDDSRFALLEASAAGNLDIVKYLIEKGAKVNAMAFYGRTAILEAASGGHLPVVQYLVEEHGIDVNSHDRKMKTVLMEAAQHGSMELVKFLVEHGADRDVYFRIIETGKTALDLASQEVKLYLLRYFLEDNREVPLEIFDVLSDSINKLAKDGLLDFEAITEFDEKLYKKLAIIIEDSPNFANDLTSRELYWFYRGSLYKNLIDLYLKIDHDEKELSFQVNVLKAIYIALQARFFCGVEISEREISKKYGNSIGVEGENLMEEKKSIDRTKPEIDPDFKKKIESLIDNEKDKDGAENKDRWLTAKNIYDEYLKEDTGCIKRMTNLVIDCAKSFFTNVKQCCTCSKAKEKDETDQLKAKKKRSCKKPLFYHKCKTRGNFALISCSLAVVFYVLDLIADFTVGLEDYRGFSRKLGIFEMVLVFVTLIHENVQSSISLYLTEEELLRIKLGKDKIYPDNWDESDLHRSENKVKQFLYAVFWPFVIRKNAGFIQPLLALLYNLLTILQLRPVVDRLRVLLHSPTSLRVHYRHRADQNSLKQCYLITEQLPQLLIQSYTLQIVFNNLVGLEQTGTGCNEGEKMFSYDRFTDSLNKPDERNWVCNMFLINSASGLLKCDIFFRLYSAMIPFFMIPAGIVSLETDFRQLDPVTPNLSTVDKYLLQGAYTFMIPARLLMFTALMHSAPMKEIVFGYIVLKIFLDISINIYTTKDHIFKARERLNFHGEVKTGMPFQEKQGVWRIVLFSLKDTFAVAARKPIAYLKSPSDVTYSSLRGWKSTLLRCLVFLVEGLVGACLIEKYYPCGRYSEVFRYLGWMCLASLLLSVTILMIISDILHPIYLMSVGQTVVRKYVKKVGFGIVFGAAACLVFFVTQKRTKTEILVSVGLMISYLVISGLLTLIVQLFASSFSKRSNNEEKNKEKTSTCCLISSSCCRVSGKSRKEKSKSCCIDLSCCREKGNVEAAGEDEENMTEMATRGLIEQNSPKMSAPDEV